MICQETDAALASIVVDYLDEVGDLISELSEATLNDQCAGDLTMRLANWLGRFQNDVGDRVPGDGIECLPLSTGA